ncbi:MAG TPA: cytochrome c3 family protein [Polyangiaceae bacterium]
MTRHLGQAARRRWVTLLVAVGVGLGLARYGAAESIAQRTQTDTSGAASSAIAAPSAIAASSESAPPTALSKARPQPNPVVIPPYRARIRAAHRVHAEQTQMACVDCHVRAKTSQRAEDWLGPEAATCDRCHGIDHRSLSALQLASDVTCRRCHISEVTERPRAHLRHSHAQHARRNIGCAQCHARVERLPDALGSERLPTKPLCVRCHAGRSSRVDGQARADCTVCHESEGGRMRTRFAGKLLMPSSTTPSLLHSNDWLYRHGDVAGNDPSRCEGCHAVRECQGCHDGRLRPRNIHPGDWLSAHAIASKQDGTACGSCHRQQSFCLRCHERLGLSASGAPGNMAARGALHPPAAIWTSGPVGPQHHATQARRNLTECVSCHQERDCVRCHQSGVSSRGQGSPFGAGLNPHPPGFAARCTSYWAANPRPCLTCHRPDGQEIQRCR